MNNVYLFTWSGKSNEIQDKKMLKIPTGGKGGWVAFAYGTQAVSPFRETEVDAINVWGNSLKGASADTC